MALQNVDHHLFKAWIEHGMRFPDGVLAHLVMLSDNREVADRIESLLGDSGLRIQHQGLALGSTKSEKNSRHAILCAHDFPAAIRAHAVRDFIDRLIFCAHAPWVLDLESIGPAYPPKHTCLVSLDPLLPPKYSSWFIHIEPSHIDWDDLPEPSEKLDEDFQAFIQQRQSSMARHASFEALAALVRQLVPSEHYGSPAAQAICFLLAAAFTSDEPLSDGTALLLAGLASKKICEHPGVDECSVIV